MVGPGAAWRWPAAKASNIRLGARPWRSPMVRTSVRSNLLHRGWSAGTLAASLCTCCLLSVVQDPRQWSNGPRSGKHWARSCKLAAVNVITTGVVTIRKFFLQIVFTHYEITYLRQEANYA